MKLVKIILETLDVPMGKMRISKVYNETFKSKITCILVHRYSHQQYQNSIVGIKDRENN